MEQDLANRSSQIKPSPLRLMILTPSQSEVQSQDTTSGQSSGEKPEGPLPQAPSFPPFLEALTGTKPAAEIESFAGYTSHPPLSLRTKYYAADVGLWCDELPSANPKSKKESRKPDTGDDDEPPSLVDWQSQMLSDEAKEVRDVIGGIILILPHSQTELSTSSNPGRSVAFISNFLPYVEAVNALREAIEDESGRDVAAIVLLQDMSSSSLASTTNGNSEAAAQNDMLEKLEDTCLSDHGIMGWDYVAWKARASNESKMETKKDEIEDQESSIERNTYGEKLGIARVLEVLEGVDWSAGPSGDEEDVIRMLASEDDFFDEDMFPKTESGNDLAPDSKPHIGLSGDFGRNADPITKQSHEFQQEMMGLRFALEKQEQGRDADTSSENAEEDSFDAAEMPRRKSQKGAGSGQGDEEIKVEQLTGLMERVVAIREAGADMSKSDREQFARREIGKIMKDLR